MTDPNVAPDRSALFMAKIKARTEEKGIPL